MKRLLALILALLCLTSCASMLEREETYTAEHVENPPALGDTGYRVNTYLGLCSALRSYVEEGMAEGNLRFPATYPGNLTVDLEKAKRELMEEYPLGCYALNDVTFHVNRIVAYYEVAAAFDYRVDPAEYRALETAYTAAALGEELETVLRDFEGGLTVVLDVPEPWTAEEFTAAGLSLAYNGNPDLALGYPELEVACYPENSKRAVAEIKLTYPESPAVLRLRQRDMLRAAEELAAGVADDAFALRDALLARCTYDPEGGSTAADALLEGRACNEGMVRAFALMCDMKGIANGGADEGEEGWFCAAETKDGSLPFSFAPLTAQGGESQ